MVLEHLIVKVDLLVVRLLKIENIKVINLYVMKDMKFHRVSVQGVESLWGDCRFIPADWGS